MQSRA